MRFLDMLRMSSSNLWKRKVRTVLTVLGVLIGTASIVVMISLGLGLSRASMNEVEQYGGLTTVTVTEQGSSYGMFEDEEQTLGQAYGSGHLDDDLMSRIRGIEHVDDVYPLLETDVLAFCGNYQASIELKGVPAEKAHLLKLDLEKGALMSGGTGQLSCVYGNMVLNQFYNEKTGSGYWYNGELADIDLMNDTILYVLNVEKYYQFLWGGASDSPGQGNEPPKKYIVNTAGVIAGGTETFNANSTYVYCDLDTLKKLLKKEYKSEVIPGQPTTNAGKAYKEIYYTSIMVNVDKMEHVQQVQKEINKLGYQASSNAEWVESIQSQTRYIQLALGGIGAVSLFVAAIGIANTMMMSIYERTKEIGIMKVLGCDMRNIRSMFLMEAGYIGLIGGVLGTAVSYAISAVINVVVKSTEMGMDAKSGISYIPLWLSVLSIFFAMFVGMLAGLLPSLRAMRLSPLAAIRNE